MQTPDQSPAKDAASEAGRESTLRGLLTVRISSLSELLRRSSTLAHRRRFNLSWVEWRVMAQAGVAPLSLNELAGLLNLDAGQVSRTVKGLTARGLLSRTPRPGGPSILIALTPAGQAIRSQMVDLAVERFHFLASDLSAEEIAQAARVLDALRDRAELLLERERTEGADQPD